jgi:hypothetical protein
MNQLHAMHVFGTLSPAQLQSIVLAYAGVAAVLIPIITGLVIMVIREFGDIKKAVGVVEGQNGTVSALQAAAIEHTRQVSALQEQVVALRVASGTKSPIDPQSG